LSRRLVLPPLPLILLVVSWQVFGYALDVALLDGGTLVQGRDTLTWDGGREEFIASDVGCDRFYGASTSPDGRTVAVWAGSDTLDCIVLVRRAGVKILGPYSEAGAPAWDGQGILWFTAEGSLLRNCIPVGVSPEAYSISLSPEGDRVAYTDRNDRILVMTVETGCVEVVSDRYRFYGPFFTPGGDLVSPSMDGGLWLFAGDVPVYVDRGEQPAWWPERDCLLYIRTTDDGMQLLSSDLWAWTPEIGSRQLSDSPGILETDPTPSVDGVFYVDAGEGLVGFVEVVEP
jgi:hypothetical protein